MEVEALGLPLGHRSVANEILNVLLRLAEGSSRMGPSSELFPSSGTGSCTLGRLGRLIAFRKACQDRTVERVSGTVKVRGKNKPMFCRDIRQGRTGKGGEEG